MRTFRTSPLTGSGRAALHRYVGWLAGISFTDLTSFVVMKEEKVTDVLTNDRHFAQVNLGFVPVPP